MKNLTVAMMNKIIKYIIFVFCWARNEKIIHFKMNPVKGGILPRLKTFIIRI